jgi:hypothetical protein
MKPIQVLFFFIIVFALLMLVSLVFPEKGIKLFNKHRFQFPHISELNNEGADYSGISLPLEAYTFDEPQSQELEIPVDTGQFNKRELNPISMMLPDSGKNQKIQLIEIPELNSNIFSHLFSNLRDIKDRKNQIRILHYGDSQIETDRMTSYIRYRLQNDFGGGGCGLFPVVPLYGGIPTLLQSNGPEWERFTGFAKRDGLAGHNRFGALFTFSRYEGQGVKENSTWLNFKPSKAGYSVSRSFNEISIFALTSEDSIELSVNINDSIVQNKVIAPDNKIARLLWKMESPIHKVHLNISGKGNMEILSLSADKSWGVSVDNIPLRGSSGLEFSKSDTVMLREMYQLMNIGMIILQFGGNIVPLMSDDYSFYKRFFERELNLIKKILPNIPIIVIGPADMSVKERGNFITYPSLTKVKEALRSATLNSGFAFWDMFEAMGGENSMPLWVSANPPLAASDYVHFNQRGARIMAEKFYDAFIFEYRKWQHSHQTN